MFTILQLYLNQVLLVVLVMLVRAQAVSGVMEVLTVLHGQAGRGREQPCVPEVPHL